MNGANRMLPCSDGRVKRDVRRNGMCPADGGPSLKRTVAAVFDGEASRPKESLDLVRDEEYQITESRSFIRGTSTTGVPAPWQTRSLVHLSPSARFRSSWQKVYPLSGGETRLLDWPGLSH